MSCLRTEQKFPVMVDAPSGRGTCKVRNEIEMKWNETKRNRTKRNQTKRNETDRNETKRYYISFRSVSISFRTLQVPSFDRVHVKSETK
jgi:hypothetical protein